MLDGVGLGAAIRAGELSAREACETALARAEADELGSVWALDAKRARAEADGVDRAIDRGEEVGELAGVPVVVKDCFDVAGLVTTAGVRRQPPPPPAVRDSAAVALLRRGGLVVLGKAAMHQLAWGMTGQAPGFPPCRHPVDAGLQPGGSSSGSAVAVAAGIVPVALGTDSGGSVRQPASWCGVAGFKPSLGAISLEGCAPMAPSLDTAGIFGRSVRDCAAALHALTGRPGRCAPTSAARVGVLESAFEAVDAGVEAACRQALQRWAAAGAELAAVELAWERRLLGPLYAAEFAAAWGAAVDADPQLFGSDVRLGISTGRDVRAVDYLGVIALLQQLRLDAAARAAGLSVLVSPTVPVLPPPLDEADAVVVAGRNTRLLNGLGWPAISIPCGRAGHLPVGLQLTAPPTREAELLAHAGSLEGLLGTSTAARSLS